VYICVAVYELVFISGKFFMRVIFRGRFVTSVG
jgi:hypothetical protein